MTRTLKLITITAALFFSFAASAQTKIFYDTDAGKEVHLKVGDRIELHLKATPSTGFMWYLQKESTPLFKFVSQTQTAPDNPMPGAGVFQIFVFEAKSSGDGVIHMHYVRAWEKPTPTDTVFTLHVIIE